MPAWIAVVASFMACWALASFAARAADRDAAVLLGIIDPFLFLVLT